MAKNALKNQSRPTQKCQCGRGDVYTDGLPGTKRIDGRLACEHCAYDSILNAHFNRKAE